MHCLHYADLRSTPEKKIIVIILSSYYKEIALISKILFPSLQVLSAGNWYTDFLRKIFGHFCLQTQTFNPIYAFLRSYRLDSLVLFDMPMKLEWPFKSNYDSQLDHNLANSRSLPTEFVNAYIKFRTYSQHRHELFHDYIALAEKSDSTRAIDEKTLGILKKALEIQSPYAILNLNCKSYNDPILDRRKIHHPERYNIIIDELISRGYAVVIQGREEQPFFAKRSGLADYSKSACTSLENDIALYSGCELIVSSKTGPENFGTIFDKPTLGLNYVEPSGLTPTTRLRYFPKKIRKKISHQILTWQEYYFHPSFFHLGKIFFDNPNEYEYLDMSEEELYDSLIEFLPHIQKTKSEWGRYTALQREFKECLTPLHLGAKNAPGVPLDTYLKEKLNPQSINSL
jgi:putative glycosyltransferase (TIGR04372 family)